MPNRLINETSPYLLQHAHNPVDWHPWGAEALEKARQEDRPILLSIGYSACHWCHVMEHESFENPEIARLMNAHFINIKVDREERPDLDTIYMEAVQAMTGRGGWPMTVFLTPDGKPFFGGTYFPPSDRGGMPGFNRVLLAMADAYRDRRGDVVQTTNQLMAHMGQSTRISRGTDPLTADLLHQAYSQLAPGFDHDHGGFGPAPKFPQPMLYELLLRYHRLANSPRALEMVETTLEHMARGGIYDQIAGGFHRYATDATWLVPHFEKMLYDNALLSRLYLHAYQLTHKPLYRHIAQEVLDYVLREMTGPQGGFYSAQDADSEGVEGKFFLWTLQEIDDLLGKEQAALVADYYGVTPQGNFEGSNILHVPVVPEEFASAKGLSLERLEEVLSQARTRLRQVREERVHPLRDEKVLAAWNGLMLRSFAEACSILDRDDYRQVAISNATFLLQELRPRGRLLRSYKDGQARINGYLEDYAFLADGLVSLYEATFDPQWLDAAVSLAEEMIDLFYDQDVGMFYDTGRDAESLVMRPRDIFDSATPCGSSVAAQLLLRLTTFTGQASYAQRAATTLRGMQQVMAAHPQGMAYWLCALDYFVTPPRELAIVGPPEDPATQALIQEVHRHYLPNKVIAGLDPTRSQGARLVSPLLQDRGMVDGKPTAYVCQDYVCQLPVTSPEALREQLG